MKNILITGVAGFIGSNLSRFLVNRGYRIFGVDDLSSGDFENIPKTVEFFEMDLSEKDNKSKLPSSIDSIIHLAGQSSGEVSFEDPIADLNKNTTSTLNLIDYAIENSIERIVYSSSMSVYGNSNKSPVNEKSFPLPCSCYGVGKLASENYLKVFNKKIPSVILRIFNVYGPGQNLKNLKQGMVSIYLAQALEKNHIEIKGSLERFRDYIFIDDVINSLYLSMKKDNAINQTFNVGTGIKTSVKDLIKIIENNFNGLSISETDSTPGDQFGIYSDIKKINTLLGFSPTTDLEEGLSKFIEWAKNDNISSSISN